MTQTLTEKQFDKNTHSFLDQLKRANTKNAYAIALNEFEVFLKNKFTLSLNEWIIQVDLDHTRPISQSTNIATESINSFVKQLSEKGLSANTINLYCAAIQSYFSYRANGRYSLTLKYAGLPKAEVKSTKEEWTLKLIKEFYESMDKSVYRAVLAVIFQSGLALEDLLSLKYGIIKDEFNANVTPLCLKLTRKKTDVSFYTFLGKDAIKALTEYFKETGIPEDNQPIFHRETNLDKPLTKAGIEKYFLRRAKKSLPSWTGSNPRRPHSLRAAFQKLLVLAGCPEIFTEYFMGHSVEKNKAAYIIQGLSKEQLREQYSKFESALSFLNIKEDKKLE